MCYEVKVVQGSGFVSFEFTGQGEAMKFADTCLECGTDEVIVSVRKIIEDEED